MNKAELAHAVAAELGITNKAAAAAIDATLGQIQAALAKGEAVKLTGFGTFEVRDRAAREGVKPGTSERVTIPAKRYPAFKAGKGLKDSVG